VGRGGIEENARSVLAADQIDVVDAEVCREELVTDRPSWTLPLDHQRKTIPQTVTRVEERHSVLPSLVERSGLLRSCE
jgi:hypothetical protein